MPPLQSSTFDLAAAIPFADRTPSPFDKLFEVDISLQQHHQQHQQQHNISHNDTPSEAEISALFGLSPVNAPTTQQPAASISAPLAHQPPQQHRSTPIRMTPAPHDKPSSVPLSMATTYVPENKQVSPQFSSFNNEIYNSESHMQPQDQQYLHQQQQHQQQQYQQYQHTPYHQHSPDLFNTNSYNTASADYSNMYGNNRYGSTFSEVDLKSSSKKNSVSNPMMLNAPSRSIFSRFGGGDSSPSGLSNEGQGISAPKIAKAAASYVSSTLAVTSTFATGTLATASTKIADLWQHNQNVLPQQQQNQNQNQHQQDTLYNHCNYYNTDALTINSGNHNTSVDSTYSYDGQEYNNNSNYQSLSHNSYNHNHNNYNHNHNHDNSSSGAKNPFSTSTTSKLSNVATVAGSYLPSLSKLPTLPALPALPALPSLPWGNRDRNQQQLPQQSQSQQSHQQQYQQKEQNQQHYSQVDYYNSYTPSQEQAYQQQAYQQHTYMDQHDSTNSYQPNGSSLAVTGNWWGEIRNEMQKGRRMVTTGVQAGVAWWWDSDAKSPLGNFV
ncbi:hypothetical protein BGZ49_009988 [Haplosporangium sp. Z 27]|nr:hypothetical protein BGZ49_009988 [Haplosporangium sp. Z 27]